MGPWLKPTRGKPDMGLGDDGEVGWEQGREGELLEFLKR